MNNEAPPANAVALKLRLPEYLNRIGCRPVFRDHRQLQLSATCPLHNDQHPSLTAKKESDAWVWFCHPCDVGGTVLELHSRRLKLDPSAQFPQICQEVAEILQRIPPQISPTDQSTTKVTKMNTHPIPNDELAALTLPWRRALYDDTTLRNKFAGDLGLPPEVFQWAANLGLEGLGIAPAGFSWQTSDGRRFSLQEPRLAYIGDGYFKLRAPFGDGQNPRFMVVGTPLRPWLSERLVKFGTTVNDVHLHESETSALALIAAGAWAADCSSIVVATSGSGGFKPECAPLFSDRVVHFWPDADDAGARFAAATAALLYGTARKIVVHEWHPTSTIP